MSGWQFKAVQKHPSGNWSLVNIKKEQQSRVHTYANALEVAGKSQVSEPKFSGYFCKGSVGYKKMYNAGNIEYGFCCSLHCEVSAGAVLRASSEQNDRSSGQLVMGFIGSDLKEGRPANPCGDCRDFMLDVFGPELEIVYGPADGGVAVVTKLGDYLFDGYETVDWINKDFTNAFVRNILHQCKRLSCDGYSPPGIHPERKYFTCITGEDGTYYGAMSLREDYHPIYPLRDAIRQAERAGNSHIHSVIIVGQDTSGKLADVPPHVMYKDRQAVFSFNLDIEFLK